MARRADGTGDPPLDERPLSDRSPWRFAAVVAVGLTVAFVGVSLLGGSRGAPLLGSAVLVAATGLLAGRWVARGDARRTSSTRAARGGPARVERRPGR